MRRLLVLVAVLALGGCDDAGGEDGGPPGVDAGARDAGAPSEDAGSPAEDAGRDAGPPGDAGVDAGAVWDCTYDDLRAPRPGTVRWPDALSATGADTLRGHGHDDGRGPVGFCPGARVPGEPFWRLVAVGFETDEDVNGDGDQGDPLPVDFWRDPSAELVGESAGRVNVYIEVVDAAGEVLNGLTSPELRYVRDIRDGPTESFGLTDKPPNEFQTNFPMTGGATYGVQMEGASDRVINLRLPNNHHVTYVLVFQREG